MVARGGARGRSGKTVAPRRIKRKKSAVPRNKGAVPNLSDKESALSLIAQNADLVSVYYRKRFAQSFRMAATWSRGRPITPADQIRNAFDHFSNASRSVQEIIKLKTKATASGRGAAKLRKLALAALLDITRGKRHIALGNYLSIVYAINSLMRLVPALIEEVELLRMRALLDERDEFRRLYQLFLETPPASTKRSMAMARLLVEIDNTDAITDKISKIARDLIHLYDALVPKPQVATISQQVA